MCSLRPASILERSSTSLISLIRCFPLLKISDKNCFRLVGNFQRRIQQDLGKTDDRIERRAKFVDRLAKKADLYG